MANRKLISFSAAVFVSLLVFFSFHNQPELRLGMGILTLVAMLWLTETFDITVTALLIPVLTVLTGLFDVKTALLAFANPIIFLFLGGFALASVMQKQQLDQYLAANVLRMAHGKALLAMLYLFAATAFLSMWISNTATTAMMIPLALGMLENLSYEDHKSSYWFLLLGIAYSANIGGIGTLIGSPPNAIAAANANISFGEWLLVGIPIVVASLPVAIAVLWLIFRPKLPALSFETSNTATLNRSQRQTLAVFSITVLLWISGQWLSPLLGIEKGFDAIVAIGAVLMITMFGLAEWKDIEKNTNWGVLLLFGGGLTLSAMMKTTGASLYLAENLSAALADSHLLIILVAITAFIVILTEFTSNTASSALLIPVFISVCSVLDLPPITISALIAIGASCAFMLPVATPPNALVFGTGFVPQHRMMTSGIFLNVIMTGLLATLAWLAISTGIAR